MAEASRAHKRQAQDDRSHAESVRNWGALAATAMAALDPPYNAYSFVAAFLTVLAAERARICSRIVNDPPRDDFRTATRLTRRQPPEDVFGQIPLERAAQEPLVHYWNADLALSAMLRAVERASGAEGNQQPKAHRARLREAYDLARESAYELNGFSTTAPGLTNALRAINTEATAARSPRSRQAFERMLPDVVLAKLYRAGIPIGMLRKIHVEEVPRGDEPPLQALAGAVSRAADGDRAYAAFIAAGIEQDRASLDGTLFQPPIADGS